MYNVISVDMLHHFKRPSPWSRIHTPSVASGVSLMNIETGSLLTLVAWIKILTNSSILEGDCLEICPSTNSVATLVLFSCVQSFRKQAYSCPYRQLECSHQQCNCLSIGGIDSHSWAQRDLGERKDAARCGDSRGGRGTLLFAGRASLLIHRCRGCSGCMLCRLQDYVLDWGFWSKGA